MESNIERDYNNREKGNFFFIDYCWSSGVNCELKILLQDKIKIVITKIFFETLKIINSYTHIIYHFNLTSI